MANEPFDWQEYFKLANELSSRHEESCLRTTISRTYYYVYHLAKQRLSSNHFTFVRGGDSHKQVWEKFSGSPEWDCKRLYNIALFLKERRERADYIEHYPRIADDVSAILIQAKDFAYILSKLNPRLPVNSGIRS